MKQELIPHENSEIVETSTFRTWIGRDNITRIVILPTDRDKAEDLQELIEAVLKLCNGELRPAIVDIRDLKILSRGIRKYYGDKDRPRAATASAFLVDSSLSKLFGNVFLQLAKSFYSAKLFTSEDEAVTWLKELK